MPAAEAWRPAWRRRQWVCWFPTGYTGKWQIAWASSLWSFLFFLPFFKKINFIMHWCFACIYICVRVSDILELESQAVLSCHAGARTRFSKGPRSFRRADGALNRWGSSLTPFFSCLRKALLCNPGQALNWKSLCFHFLGVGIIGICHHARLG